MKQIKRGFQPRIALFDIETAPIKGFTWEMFDTNVMHVEEPTYLLCYAWKWLDESKVHTKALCDYPGYEQNKTSDKALAADLWKVMDDADIIVGHNGDAFDIKKANARFIVHGLKPPSTYKTVDTLKIARRNFKFDSNKLDNIGRYLQVGRKMPHTGKDLWLGCMSGDRKSWATMKKYNAQDVRLLERVYLKLRGWAANHPNLNAYTEADGCPTCQSANIQRRGVQVSKTRKSQRFQCLDCGTWFSGDIIKAA